MSWGEVFKINKNMKRSLDEQLRDMKFQPIRVITATGTYTPEKTGLYKVICVGAGGKGVVVESGGSYMGGGGGGGVAIKTLRLVKSTSYNITIGTTASFSNTLTATAGSSPMVVSGVETPGKGGTATGGDNNFTGESGEFYVNDYANYTCRGGSVGVMISDLSRHHFSYNSNGMLHTMGDSLLEYGGGGAASKSAGNIVGVSNGHPAAVIIIPLEMEE